MNETAYTVYLLIITSLNLNVILNISFILKLLFKKAKYISVFGNVVNHFYH